MRFVCDTGQDITNIEADRMEIQGEKLMVYSRGAMDYMRLCFAMMEAADVVLFMRDYQDSRGAMLEWAWCQHVGKQTCFDLVAFGGAKAE